MRPMAWVRLGDSSTGGPREGGRENGLEVKRGGGVARHLAGSGLPKLGFGLKSVQLALVHAADPSNGARGTKFRKAPSLARPVWVEFWASPPPGSRARPSDPP